MALMFTCPRFPCLESWVGEMPDPDGREKEMKKKKKLLNSMQRSQGWCGAGEGTLREKI